MRRHSFTYLVLVPTYMIPHTALKMGIAYYHPDEKEQAIMKELMQCLDLESDFKKFNIDMFHSPIYLANDFQNASNMWMVYIAIIFGVLLIIGCALEYVLKKGRKEIAAPEKPSENYIDKGLNNSEYI